MMRDFTQDFLKDFDISVPGTHVAYVVYGQGASRKISFPIKPSPNSPYNRDLVRGQIDKSVQPVGGNRKDLYLGLQLAEQAFKSDSGGRPGARKVNFICTILNMNVRSVWHIQ